MANDYGFDPTSYANGVATDERASNATLMFQKGLGSFAEVDQNQKKLALEQLKSKYDQLNKEKDDYAAVFGNKEYSAQTRLQAFNSMVAIDKTLNPASKLLPLDKFDSTAEQLGQDFGAARQELTEKTIDRAAYNKRIMFAAGAAMKAAQSMDEITSIEDMQKKAMDAVAGSTQTVKTGKDVVQGTNNPLDNTVEPYKTPSGPAVSPNVEAQTYQQEYGAGGLKQQDMAIKQQNADTASSLISQKSEALDVSTAKTILDGLNSSDKAKSNLAVQQFFNSILPPEVAGLVIDQNKLANDSTRKKIADFLGSKVGVQTQQPVTEPTAGKKAPPAGTVVIIDKAGKRFAVAKEKADKYIKQGYTLGK